MSIFNFISKIDDPRSDINKKHELMDVTGQTVTSKMKMAITQNRVQGLN
jgi:hypothetical protein